MYKYIIVWTVYKYTTVWTVNKFNYEMKVYVTKAMSFKTSKEKFNMSGSWQLNMVFWIGIDEKLAMYSWSI